MILSWENREVQMHRVDRQTDISETGKVCIRRRWISRKSGRKSIEKLMASMDIPYKPGVLEGVVYKDGAKISRSTLVTPKEAAVLELVSEEESFAADGKDLIYVRVTLKDADGNRLTQDEREIQVETDGVGTFLAVGNGNPCTEDQITDTKCHLYRGTAIVILKSKEAGETKITVKADGVAAGSCVVEAK